MNWFRRKVMIRLDKKHRDGTYHSELITIRQGDIIVLDYDGTFISPDSDTTGTIHIAAIARIQLP